MDFAFEWTNYRDEWRAITGPVIGVVAFGGFGAVALVVGLPDVGLAFLGIAVVCVGLLVPQIGDRRGETVRVVDGAVLVGQAAWWRHIATYGLVGLGLVVAGMVETVLTDPEGAPLMLVLGPLLGVCLIVNAVVLWLRRGGFVFGPDGVVTPRGRTIPHDLLVYRLYEPPRGAPSVQIGIIGGPKPEYMTAFGYMISPSAVLSTLDALTAHTRTYSPREIRAMLTVPPQRGVAEGDSIVLRLPAEPAGGDRA